MEFKLKEFKIDLCVERLANIHYFEFVKEYHTFKDSHPFRELIYVDSGEITVEAEGYSGKLGDKQLLIHKSDEAHSLYCPENIAPNVIIIGFECDCRELDVFSSAPVTLSDDLTKMLAEVVREGRSVFLPPYDIPNLRDMKKREDFAFGADQMIKLWFEMFLIGLVRSAAKHEGAQPRVSAERGVEAIRDYIEQHYMERITLDDLCFLFGTNKTTICHSFKAAYGDTLIHYINRLRIKKAKKLMREGNMNLSELAARVGFSSIHYFSKVFKFYEQKSPTEYFATIKSKLEI
ncbi:MAG: helix-turn-helix transcriptional regulator [Clostridia bacterium]|nr:helix-turn-helix transcriptional regulator [Clostridia bacterium]